MKQVKFGSLDTYVIDSANGHEDGPTLILLHGFGAPGDDLVALARFLNLPSSVRCIFPIAPLTAALGIPGARAWWQLDLERMARDQASGKGRNIQEIPKGLSEARIALHACLTDIHQSWDIPYEKMILGGFSQGAMLACDTVLRSLEPIAGLILMSTTIIAKKEWQSLMASRKELPIFQSHGTEDPILPFQTASALHDLFRTGGWNITWQEFVGGHEIPPLVLKGLVGFIRNCFEIEKTFLEES